MSKQASLDWKRFFVLGDKCRRSVILDTFFVDKLPCVPFHTVPLVARS